MEKRGQVFLVAALILALVLFSIAITYNEYEEKILLEDFPDLSSNYQKEAVKVVNEALLSGENPTGELQSFTTNYVEYARSVDPNIGFIYVYRNKDPNNEEVYIANYLKDNVNYIPNNDPALESTVFSDTQNAITDISIEAGDFTFKKTIPIRLNNFDDYTNAILSGNQINLEIGGIFYPVNLKTDDLQIIGSSNSQEEKTVSWEEFNR